MCSDDVKGWERIKMEGWHRGEVECWCREEEGRLHVLVCGDEVEGWNKNKVERLAWRGASRELQ